jgi:hypothetical protein
VLKDYSKYGEDEKCTDIYFGKSQVRRSLARPRCRCADYSKRGLE